MVWSPFTFTAQEQNLFQSMSIYLEMEGGEINVNAYFLVKWFSLCKAEQ